MNLGWLSTTNKLEVVELRLKIKFVYYYQLTINSVSHTADFSIILNPDDSFDEMI